MKKENESLVMFANFAIQNLQDYIELVKCNEKLKDNNLSSEILAVTIKIKDGVEKL